MTHYPPAVVALLQEYDAHVTARIAVANDAHATAQDWADIDDDSEDLLDRLVAALRDGEDR